MENGYTHKSIKKLFALARGQLIGKYSIAILATLIISMIEVLLSFITGVNSISSSAAGYLTNLIITIVVDLLLGILVYGQCVFYLNIVRGINASIPDLFRGFKGITDKTILVQSVFTGFSVLSLIPSVLLHFNIIYVPEEYSSYTQIGVLGLQLILSFCANLYFGLSFYILADHPDWSVPDILRDSLSLMKKKKGKLLLTYLRAFPLLIVAMIACGLGVLWFFPFFNAVLANFYLDAVGEEAFDAEKAMRHSYEDLEKISRSNDNGRDSEVY